MWCLLGSVLGMVSKGAQKVPQKAPKGDLLEVLGGDFEGKGGIPKVVPPLYEEGPPHLQHRSSLRSNLEAWRHVKIEDSYTFWKDFGLLENNSRGLFGVCFGHASQGRPKGCPKALKRCSMMSPKVPKGHPTGP